MSLTKNSDSGREMKGNGTKRPSVDHSDLSESEVVHRQAAEHGAVHKAIVLKAGRRRGDHICDCGTRTDPQTPHYVYWQFRSNLHAVPHRGNWIAT
ncbi:hypothetical protein J6590_002024 [Homalodisca vitripennis]|nr:hypothetical protein J6590_002024 [Homalodisca vitripennis]